MRCHRFANECEVKDVPAFLEFESRLLMVSQPGTSLVFAHLLVFVALHACWCCLRSRRPHSVLSRLCPAEQKIASDQLRQIATVRVLFEVEMQRLECREHEVNCTSS